MSELQIPRRGPGRPTVDSELAWRRACAVFASQLKQIKSALGNKVQAVRSWCYDLESFGLKKNEFDYAEGLINDLRVDGLLAINFTAEDITRKATGGQGLVDSTTPEEEAEYIYENIIDEAENYRPESFWDTQEFYVEMIVEKMDLRHNTFGRALNRYPIACTNGKGWSDINSRAAMAYRFQAHEEEGRTPVLLYCADHDPKGLEIADRFRKNLHDMDGTFFENGNSINWNADSLIFDRFALTEEFIEENNLTWIDNLITTSGADLANPKTKAQRKEAAKPYVVNYIARYGPRKCEANALTVIPKAGYQLCMDTIHKYIDVDAAYEYDERIEAARSEVREHLEALLTN